MINEAISSEINPLSNNNLENETLTGEYLRGIEFAPKFIDLINDLSNLPIIELREEPKFFNDVMELKSILVDEITSLLDRKEVIKIYNGDSKVINLLKSLDKQIDSILPDMRQQAIEQAHTQAMDKLNKFDSADAEGIATLVDLHAEPEQDHYTPFIEALQVFEAQIKGIVSLVESIEGRYFEDKVKVPKKAEDFPMYIAEQMFTLEDKELPSGLLLTLMPALTTIENSIPVEELDPMKIDEFDNLIELFRRPERFYFHVKHGNIVSPAVTEKFAQVFNETYQQAIDIVIDKIDKVDYNKKITTLNQCALQSDDQELVTLCTQQYNKGA